MLNPLGIKCFNDFSGSLSPLIRNYSHSNHSVFGFLFCGLSTLVLIPHVWYFIVLREDGSQCDVAGLRGIQAAEHAQWPFVPYWNEVVNEKCVKLARGRWSNSGSIAMLSSRQKGLAVAGTTVGTAAPTTILFWNVQPGLSVFSSASLTVLPASRRRGTASKNRLGKTT